MAYICGYCNKPVYEGDNKVYLDGIYYHSECSKKIQDVYIPHVVGLYKKGDNKYNPLALPFFVKHRDATGKVYYECKMCHSTIHKPVRGDWQDVLFRHMRYYHEYTHNSILQVVKDE